MTPMLTQRVRVKVTGFIGKAKPIGHNFGSWAYVNIKLHIFFTKFMLPSRSIWSAMYKAHPISLFGRNCLMFCPAIISGHSRWMGNGDQLLPIHPQADEWGMNNILVLSIHPPFIPIHPPFIHKIHFRVSLNILNRDFCWVICTCRCPLTVNYWGCIVLDMYNYTLLEVNRDEWRMNGDE